MKRKRSDLELDDEDESDESQPLIDSSETLDDSDLVNTSGPPQLGPKVSPAQEPPTRRPQKDPAPSVISEDDDDDDDDDDDERWQTAPGKLPSILPGFTHPSLQAIRLNKEEIKMLREHSKTKAATRVEDQARVQAQNRPKVVQSPSVSNTPSSSKAHGKSPLVEAEEKEKILIQVQNSDGDIQPIQMFTTDKFEKLFRAYAEACELSLANLSFHFDGGQLAPDSTPKYHAMKDSELIEVYNMI